jgi:hypothetical protein
MVIKWDAVTKRGAAPDCTYHENHMSNIDNLSIQLYTLRSDPAATARASYAFISRMGV